MNSPTEGTAQGLLSTPTALGTPTAHPPCMNSEFPGPFTALPWLAHPLLPLLPATHFDPTSRPASWAASSMRTPQCCPLMQSTLGGVPGVWCPQ